MSTDNIEAVQFTLSSPWHAVVPGEDGVASDVTFCGLDVRHALLMFHYWDEKVFHCQRCVRLLDRALADGRIITASTEEDA